MVGLGDTTEEGGRLDSTPWYADWASTYSPSEGDRGRARTSQPTTNPMHRAGNGAWFHGWMELSFHTALSLSRSPPPHPAALYLSLHTNLEARQDPSSSSVLCTTPQHRYCAPGRTHCPRPLAKLPFLKGNVLPLSEQKVVVLGIGHHGTVIPHSHNVPMPHLISNLIPHSHPHESDSNPPLRRQTQGHLT
jgi:hypothetical protein